MPETPPTPPAYSYPPAGMMPPNMQPGAAPGAPAPDAGAAAPASGAKPPGSGSPQTAGAALVGNLDIGIRSVV